MARINEKHGGRRPNSGRKSKAEEFGLARLLEQCWTTEQRREVIEALYSAAVGGNVQAAALLLAYAYGKPTETIQATITHKEYEVEIGGDSHISTSEQTEQFVN